MSLLMTLYMDISGEYDHFYKYFRLWHRRFAENNQNWQAGFIFMVKRVENGYKYSIVDNDTVTMMELN